MQHRRLGIHIATRIYTLGPTALASSDPAHKHIEHTTIAAAWKHEHDTSHVLHGS